MCDCSVFVLCILQCVWGDLAFWPFGAGGPCLLCGVRLRGPLCDLGIFHCRRGQHRWSRLRWGQSHAQRCPRSTSFGSPISEQQLKVLTAHSIVNACCARRSTVFGTSKSSIYKITSVTVVPLLPTNQRVSSVCAPKWLFGMPGTICARLDLRAQGGSWLECCCLATATVPAAEMLPLPKNHLAAWCHEIPCRTAKSPDH